MLTLAWPSLQHCKLISNLRVSKTTASPEEPIFGSFCLADPEQGDPLLPRVPGHGAHQTLPHVTVQDLCTCWILSHTRYRSRAADVMFVVSRSGVLHSVTLIQPTTLQHTLYTEPSRPSVRLDIDQTVHNPTQTHFIFSFF